MNYLNDVEAFYLLSKGRLVLVDESNEEISNECFASKAIEANPLFLAKYKVYSYFRDKGFVVRSGINFGVDYTVYQSLPHLCHSEYCVSVVDCSHTGIMRNHDTAAVDDPGFRYLTSLSRTMTVSI